MTDHTDVTKQLLKLKISRSHNIAIVAALRSASSGNDPLTRFANNIENCSTWIKTADCPQDGLKHYAGTTRCRNRYCVTCAHLRGLSALKRYLPFIMDEVVYGRKLLFGTLTLTNRPNLAKMFDELSSGVKKLTRRDFWRDQVHGAIFGYETTQNKSTEYWHCHVHVLLSVDKRIPIEQLSNIWLDITGDSYIVHLKEITNLKTRLGTKSLIELFKYPFKPMNLKSMKPEHVYEMVETFHYRRLLRSTGCFYGKVSMQQIEDDLADDITYDIRNLRCHLCGNTLDENFIQTDSYTGKLYKPARITTPELAEMCIE